VNPLLIELSGGDRRSIGRSNEVSREISRDAEAFAVVIGGITSDDPLIRMRATDAVEKASRISPHLLQPHKRRLLTDVAGVEQQEVRWHLAQILPRLRLTPKERRKAVTLLESFLEDTSRIVQVNALQALTDLALRDGRLRARVIPRVESSVAKGSPAVRARGRKLLQALRD
jgi:hypothetical protein